MTVATRRIAAPPERVLSAVGRVLRAPPFSLSLLDAIGGHPLSGGVLRFTLPVHTGLMGAGASWSNLGLGTGAREVDVAILSDDASACEVRMSAPGRDRLSRGAVAEMAFALAAVAREVQTEAVFAPL